MYCRYSRVYAKCSKVAADWQFEFTSQLTNTVPNNYYHVIHPNGADVIEIIKCTQFLPGSPADLHHFLPTINTFYDLNNGLKVPVSFRANMHRYSKTK